MLVSWNWLKDYVALDMDQAELENRLAMSGLNHEGTEAVADDLSIDLEVTSNRPDCLGHIGVAREVAVLWDQPLKLPSPNPTTGSTPVSDLTKVTINCPELCYRYTARVIRGVKIGPSPEWLTQRLRTVFRKRKKDGTADEYQPINNVVDITNYVLMECGQPLHAFDLNELVGPEIIVREALKNEQFEAIDHHTYSLEPGMCVIADKDGAVALGGVMGGADTEVSDRTTDLLIEAAEFSPVSIRNTARKLNLYSPSSHRFERRVDPEGIDWASRRCCELILEIAGGELAESVIDVGAEVAPREPVVLRLSQLKRVLGIEIAESDVRRILQSLGCCESKADASRVEVVPPTWRRDLTREIDLVEEVARVHGYDEIPEDANVPMVPSHRTESDRVLDKLRRVLTAAGFDEAMTASMVPAKWNSRFRPWSSDDPLLSSMSMLKGADRLRQSLVPSLLEARRINESLANPVIELFETARVYLPSKKELPIEQPTLCFTSGGDFLRVKGVVEALLNALNPNVRLEAGDFADPLLEASKSATLRVGDALLGFVGELSAAGLKKSGLRNPAAIAELNIDVLSKLADLVPQYQPQSLFPSIARDLNMIVDEPLRWAQLAATVRGSAGEMLEELTFQDIYRDTKKDGEGKKRMLFSLTLRAQDRTMTGEEADAVRDAVVKACGSEHGAVLLG